MKKAAVIAALVIIVIGGIYFTKSGKQETAKPNDGKVYEIAISHIVNEDHTWHKASVMFKEYLEEKSDGRIVVKLYPNSQLGNEIDTINSIMTNGGADITYTGESMQSVIPEMGILGVPYLIRSSEHLNKVAGGDIGKKLEALMSEQANMISLGYFERGSRNITANKPIRTLADIKALVIRVPSSPITVAAMEALGAKPTPMAFAEVFTSLQQGTIQAQENPLAIIKTGNFYEVQKYLCRTEHLRSYLYAAMSKSKFDSLPEDLQALVLEAGVKMQEYEHELFLKEEQELEDFLKDKGMIFVEDVDREALAVRTLEGVEKVLPDKIRPLYDEIKAMD